MEKKVVVALGGNAILSDDASAQAQQEALITTSKHLVNLVKENYKLIISHGNGPQVGNLLLQQQAANSDKNPAMPLDTCVAMTQGSIGYWLANAMTNELKHEGIQKEVATILTQVIVDENDEAFKNPTKPIGPFLTEEVAKEEAKITGAIFKEDAGRGYRKVVASPKPIGIHEAKTINTLIDNDVITISCGGGGIPVVGQELKGVEAVIDKDFASEKLAHLVKADMFIVLTGVDNVYINYGKENEQKLTHVTVEELEVYKSEGHFAPGSMLPKIEAAIQFAKNNPGKQAIITSLECLGELNSAEEVGTIITL
ncbi:carbamate kinase [Vagococcus fluvialis]|uniref:carbamate kinase n=1 Tax=Vagococcus fluvialis TaxID=2738 RepID=UPI001432EBC4|nr:carbamate kinase [Vagococcus fluvialis]MBO0444574.1 carbamate kinase [Vagococcus fluvialis]MBO0488319.1 carbamate kinase [Vagococcus fluvialis]MCM2140129.1 carbamate kinase [Vagococcus fluvialis]MDT2746985.1 carbamate kinase [Vagococcus fluvialis]NKC60814.1 carbamate kinase [Vagococcus fluvialis]